MTPCRCGCGTLVGRRDGRQRLFVNRAHYSRALAGPRYAAFRQQRAHAAGAAARRAHQRRAHERAARFATPAVAYAAGYRQGYEAAARWWRRKLRALRGAAA